MFFEPLGEFAGGFIPFPGGSALGKGLGRGIDSIIGGNSGGSQSGGGGSLDPYTYALQAAQLAALNAPLTAATTELGGRLGSLFGIQGLQGNLAGSGQLSQLADALADKDAGRGYLSAEVLGYISGAQQALNSQNQGRLAGAFMPLNFSQQAGLGMLGGENQIALDAAGKNNQLKAMQELYGLDVAKEQARAMGDVFNRRAQAFADGYTTRARTKGGLALGAQRIEGNIKQTQADTIRDLSRIKGLNEAQFAQKRFDTGNALMGLNLGN